MKYPQLVSPRAVSAISDWLVSRLEQLGVESPQIYTRLLLSLLQSSVQVNDPIEFSNLEAFFANRKGGHKRFHLPFDTETLKKLNAVQCLREIVSNEQETSTIEQLVNELCEKLKDVEKQTQNLSDEERFLIETHLNTDSLLQTQSNTQFQHNTSSSYNNQHHNTRNHHQQHPNHPHQPQQQQITQICNKPPSSTFNNDSKRLHVSATSDALNDLDNDPKKRYFRAFPALSKEMEDSFRIWRRNAKSLTWPVVGRSIVVDNLNNSSASLSSSSASSIISSNNFGANTGSADKSVEKKSKRVVVGHQLENKVSATGTGIDNTGSGCSVNIGSSDVQQHQGAAAASVKKKSKRRRNQALCKGKTIQNIRKLSVGTTSNSVSGNKFHHYTHHRNASPAWDTDFKGCWEMGPDLIKEFLSRQNGNKRNRSNSDSMDQVEHNERKIVNEMPTKNDDKPIMKRYIDLSFCYDDDEDDDEVNDDVHQQRRYTEVGVDYVDEDYDVNTLASVSELTMDCSNPKRLYQREGHTQKPLTFGGNVLIGKNEDDNTLDGTSDSVDPVHFQQFKAKFNSSVEALWKDVEPTPTTSSQRPTESAENSLKLNNNSLGGGISSAFYATTSLNALAPFKNDLWNFWSNYQQQHYDQLNNKLSTTASTSSMITTTRLDDSSASSGAGADIANSSDYFSMPSNLDDFDKSVGGIRRTNEAGASLGAHTPSINVFLQNSIWSTSGDCVDAIGTTSATTAADTDESFLFKVWRSNKKLSELDVGNEINCEKIPKLMIDNNEFKKSKESSSLMPNNPNLGANLQFPSYQNLKWSEGINAGPPCSSIHGHGNVTHHEMESSLRTDNNYSSFSSVANISGATWEAPAYGQNAQPDLKSWCASNPMSLTEMYGSDVCDSIVNQASVEDDEPNQVDIALTPAVTLPNHCANTSSFMAYSRIKQCGIVQPQTKPLQTSSTAERLAKDLFRSSEEENLLTSDRTHFHPIENFVDGHTFDISNAFDTVEFERTSSGLMRYESEEYLEYTRNDIYMADEEVSTNSTNLLKYGRKANEDKNDKFIIKFRVKRVGEIACQTEEQDFQVATAKLAEVPTSCTHVESVAFPPPLELNNMFHNTFSSSRQANNEAIMAAVTKAVAAAAKAAAENHLNAGHFSWLPNANIATNATESGANTRDTNPLWRPDNSICDEVDFCKVDSTVRGQEQHLTENWSMQEVEKQCHQRRCLTQQQQEIKRNFPTSTDIERNEENSLDNASLHTLWGMCAVCNSCEYGNSMPANRLLRDELQLEADEIMSDLRYMQDLYIGESDILNETNENYAQGENDLMTDDKMFGNINKEIEMKTIKNPWHMDIKESKNQKQDVVQVSMLKKVNQLIEDLLKPEKTGKLTTESVEYDNIMTETQVGSDWNMQADQNKTKNLWQFNEQDDDNNVWQLQPLVKQFEDKTGKNHNNSETFVKPMKLLKQVGDSLNDETQYRESLNWKHDNLAKIWQKNVPTFTQLEESITKHKQNETANDVINENFLIGQEQPVEVNQKLVEEKNLKNLQNSQTLTPPSTLPCNTYKRVQQFLNNSAAKLKLAANRKRRHSASQNYYQQQHLQYSSSNHKNNSNNNNNNDNITDLNAYKLKLNDTLEAAKEQQQEVTPFNNSSTLLNNANTEEQPAKQTIITCKYWTTATNGTQSSLDSAAAAMMLLAAATNVNKANDRLTTTTADSYDQEEDVMLDENIFGNTFSCLIDKNASILKHVTMVTRPLTR